MGLRLLTGGMAVSAAMVIPSRMKHTKKGFEDLHENPLDIMTDEVFLLCQACIVWLRPPGDVFDHRGSLVRAVKMRPEALAVSSCSSQDILASSNQLCASGPRH